MEPLHKRVSSTAEERGESHWPVVCAEPEIGEPDETR